MEYLAVPSEKSEPKTWGRVHAMAGDTSDYATESYYKSRGGRCRSHAYRFISIRNILRVTGNGLGPETLLLILLLCASPASEHPDSPAPNSRPPKNLIPGRRVDPSAVHAPHNNSLFVFSSAAWNYSADTLMQCDAGSQLLKIQFSSCNLWMRLFRHSSSQIIPFRP